MSTETWLVLLDVLVVIPLAAWAGVAPTAVRPCRTTTKALMKPTRAVTTPAATGRLLSCGMRTR